MILRRDFLKSALAVGFAAGSHSQLWASSNAPPDRDEPQVRRFPHHAEVVKIEDLNHNVKRIRLKPQQADEFVFTPGQHVLLKAPDDYLADWNKRGKPVVICGPAGHRPEEATHGNVGTTWRISPQLSVGTERASSRRVTSFLGHLAELGVVLNLGCQ